MARIQDFGTEFVQRTRLLLTEYKGEYKLSNALNCMLGLIVLPNERLEQNNDAIWDTLLENIPEMANLHINAFDPIRNIRRGRITYYPKTLRYFLKKVRNGIAHQNIAPINTNKRFTGVTIWNYFGANKNNMDLNIELNRSELKRFALFVAEKYLGE